jgi:hypothetical protein
MYLTLAFLTFRLASRTMKRVRNDPELEWTGNLAAMVQVSLVGYWISGAFLGLAYFDLYYHLIALVVILDRYVSDARRAESLSMRAEQAASDTPVETDPAATGAARVIVDRSVRT